MPDQAPPQQAPSQPAPAQPAPPSQAPPQQGQVSPDQLDRLLTLIRPRLWIVLAALLVLVALAVVWGFVGTVTETVGAKGVVHRGAGLQVVQASSGGRVESVAVSVGDAVQRGDRLATLVADDGTRTPVTAPADATVADLPVAAGAIVDRGARLAGLQPSDGMLHATLAVPVGDRGDVDVGQEVEVRLDDALDSELGYVKGRVASIAPYPASDDELNRAFGNQRLVSEVAGGSAVYLTQVELLADQSTRSGLAWSSEAGAGAVVDPGEIADARIIVSEQSFVEQVFP